MIGEVQKYDRTAIVNLESEDQLFRIASRSLNDKKSRTLGSVEKRSRVAFVDIADEILQRCTASSRLYVLGHGNLAMPPDFINNAPDGPYVLGGNATVASGFTPMALAQKLYDGGLRNCKVIYLVICNSGNGGDRSFAKRFADALRGLKGVTIGEVRAPKGYVKISDVGRKMVAPKGTYSKDGPRVSFVTATWDAELLKGENKFVC